MERSAEVLDETKIMPFVPQTGALPPAVVERLLAYRQQIERLETAQSAFMEGVFASLGLRGPVRVNLKDMTYSVEPEGSNGRDM